MTTPRDLGYVCISSIARITPVIKQSASSWISGFLFAILPSFIQRRLRPNEFKPRRLTSTSWLDGLRGVAALFVYINHYTGANYGRLQRVFGDHTSVPWSSPLQLPFIRVIYCGLPMVHIFFVISGFVLSYKPMKLIKAQNYEELNKTLSSSVFRRGFRLYLPTVAATLFTMLSRYFEITSGKLPSLIDHIRDWLETVWIVTDSWSWDVFWYAPYDVHLWTIGIEFSHSMLLFITVIGTCRLRPFLRSAILVSLSVYCLRGGHWGPPEFLAGVMIAEYTVMKDGASSKKQFECADEGGENERDELIPSRSTGDSLRQSAKRLFIIAFFIMNLMWGLFIVGWPYGDVENTPGFSFMYRHTMEPFYSKGGNVLIFPWYALAAVQIVVAINQLPKLQNVFTSAIAQYLGDISFSLYLMHGPMQKILEWRTVDTVWHWFVEPEAEEFTMWQYSISWFCGLMILAPITIWVSDIFWRLVDMRSVRFARWLEGICITRSP